MSENFTVNLHNTCWYVPTEYLPALQYTPGERDPFKWAADQTLWHITECREGYFIGKAYVELRIRDEEPTYSCLNFVGSLTPDANVYMSFLPDSAAGTAMVTTGIGRMRHRDNRPVFEMQMATGLTSLLSHWAYMEECKPGDEAWDCLPGTNLSVTEFIKQCERNEA